MDHINSIPMWYYVIFLSEYHEMRNSPQTVVIDGNIGQKNRGSSTLNLICASTILSSCNYDIKL